MSLDFSYVDKLTDNFQKGIDIVDVIQGKSRVIGLGDIPEINSDVVKSQDKNINPDSSLSGDVDTGTNKKFDFEDLDTQQKVLLGVGVLVVGLGAVYLIKRK